MNLEKRDKNNTSIIKYIIIITGELASGKTSYGKKISNTLKMLQSGHNPN